MKPFSGGGYIELIGIILKGRYCIVEQIGKGGQGTLYLARDLELGIFRAVKELPEDKKREAGLLRLLEYPSLPGMVDYAEQNGRCYLVMEYIRGKSLRQYLEEGRRFSSEEILYIGKTVLRTLRYLHSRKPAIYYGDLKPDNLMMTEEGSLYLVDFGSAVLGYERWSFICCGTKEYAAPEQYQGQIDEASDLYAFGKTMKELCRRNRYFCFLRYPGFAGFLQKCCRKIPAKRWKNAQEALNCLNNLKTLSAKMWRLSALAAGSLIVATGIFVFFPDTSRVRRPDFEKAVAPVLSRYTSMGFRSGGSGVREILLRQIEEDAQRLLAEYQEPEHQIRILRLLAANSEIQGNYAKAEIYYRQLTEEKNAGAEDYAVYGMFLERNGRQEESQKLYNKFRKKIKKEKPRQEGRNLKIWKQYLRKYTE